MEKKEPEIAVDSSKPGNSVIKALELNWLSVQGKRIAHEHKLRYFTIACVHRFDTAVCLY